MAFDESNPVLSGLFTVSQGQSSIALFKLIGSFMFQASSRVASSFSIHIAIDLLDEKGISAPFA